MKKYRIRNLLQPFLTALVITGFTACNHPIESPPESIIQGALGQKIDAQLSPFPENMLSSYDLPGLVIGVVKNKEVVYARAFGYKNIEKGESASIRDLYHMASISKPFVATAVMQLVEQGKIHLDSPVVSYLPYFKLEGDSYKTITIKQMLNHISGMPDVEDYQWDNPVYSEDAIEQYVRSISSEQMQSNPGENFAYSNMAFECLGDVIAKVSGMSFAEYQKINILNPSGMVEGTFLKPEYLPDNWAAPHIRILTSQTWEGYPYNRRHGPSSTLHANVLEMCNWAITNLNQGVFEDGRILDAKSFDALWEPWFEIGEDNYIGLSWFIGNYQGEKTIGHSGGDTGFSTNLVMLPEKSLGVVVMCNQSRAPVQVITDAALDILLDYQTEKIALPANTLVTSELQEKGLEAAVIMWDSLQANHGEEYDFSPEQFSGLFVALQMDKVEQAELLTQLCLRIFPPEINDYIQEQTEIYLEHNPDNQAARAMLRVIEEN